MLKLGNYVDEFMSMIVLTGDAPSVELAAIIRLLLRHNLGDELMRDLDVKLATLDGEQVAYDQDGVLMKITTAVINNGGSTLKVLDADLAQHKADKARVRELVRLYDEADTNLKITAFAEIVYSENPDVEGMFHLLLDHVRTR